MGWNQLLDIKNQAKADARKPEVRVPEMCPIDGERLEINSKGERNCPMGNFRWP